MKVIELLIKAANGEELPKKIRWGTNEFIYDGCDYIHTEFGTKFLNRLEINNLYLDDEIEIIEEDKEIEEAKIKTFEDTGEAVTILRVHEYNDLNFKELKRVTDELIKAVNELKKGK